MTAFEGEVSLAQELDILRSKKALAQHEVYGMEREVDMLSRRTSFRSRGSRSSGGDRGRYSSSSRFFGMAQTGSDKRTDENGYAPQPTVQSVVTVVDDEDKKRRKRDRSESAGKERKRRRTSPPPPLPDPVDSAETRRKHMKKLRQSAKKNTGMKKRNMRFFGRALQGHLVRAAKDNYKRDKKKKNVVEKKAKELLEKQRQKVDESAREVLLQKLATKRKDNDAIQRHFDWRIQKKQNELLCAKLRGHYDILSKFFWTNAAGTSIAWCPADMTGKEDVFEDLRSSCKARLNKDYETEERHIKENEPEEPELPEHILEERKKVEEAEREKKEKEEMEEDFPLAEPTEPTVKEEPGASQEPDRSGGEISGEEE